MKDVSALPNISLILCNMIFCFQWLTFTLLLLRVSFVDPVAVRHALGIISDLAMIDPYSVAVALGSPYSLPFW